MTVRPLGEEIQLGSLNAGSTEAEPKGFIRIKENDASLLIALDWWQGQVDELTDGKGSHLSVPTGTCRKSVTVPLQSDKPVVIPCWDGKPPYASFDAVTIRRLN